LGWPPLITARYFSSCPSDSTSRWTPCPPDSCRKGARLSLASEELPPLSDMAPLIWAPEGLQPSRTTCCSAHTMGRSDSRTGPLAGLCFPLPRRGLPPLPRRVSQAPRLICPHALSPLTPESPEAAVAHCFTSGSRVHHTWKTGHFPFALTGPYRVCCHYGSRVRLPELCQSDRSFPRLVGYLLYEQLQGKLLSAYKISQACPGVLGLMA